MAAPNQHSSTFRRSTAAMLARAHATLPREHAPLRLQLCAPFVVRDGLGHDFLAKHHLSSREETEGQRDERVLAEFHHDTAHVLHAERPVHPKVHEDVVL